MEHLILGLNTTLIGMGIVFLVLIALWLIVVLEHKAVSYFVGRSPQIKPTGVAPIDTAKGSANQHPCKRGLSDGISTIEGVEDDEILAVIFAAIGEHTEIPMSELKIVSVRAV